MVVGPIARLRPRTANAAAEAASGVHEAKSSKSARKREFLALQDLGEQLLRLKPCELALLPLDERLLQAVAEAASIRSRGALRRQRQLIGKLMRAADADAIRASLDSLGRSDRQATQLFHAAERWRDRICAEGSSAIADLGGHAGETAGLRRLAQEISAAADEDRRRHLGRQIFREVHAILTARFDTASSAR